MREFVDQNDLGPPRENGVQVHLLQAMPSILDAPSRNDLQPLEKRLRFGPAMRLDHADDDIDAFSPASLGRRQHLVSLADPRSRADKNLEPAAPTPNRFFEQGVRRGTIALMVHRRRPQRQARRRARRR
jgi:hypothetical protein